MDVMRNTLLANFEREMDAIAVANGDVLQILDRRGCPPDRYRCVFHGLEWFLRNNTGQVDKVNMPIPVEITFPEDYWAPATDKARQTLGLRVLGVLAPLHHPNVRAPGACLGNLRPATNVPELMRSIWGLLTYTLLATEEPLDQEASKYFISHPERLRELRNPSFRHIGGRGEEEREVQRPKASGSGALGDSVVVTVEDI